MSLTRNHLAEYSHWTPSEVNVIDGVATKYSDVIVHEFLLSDSDDPEMYAASAIWEWQQSDVGQWVMTHAVEKPYWVKRVDLHTYSYRCSIVARLSEPDQVFYRLKYVGTKN